MVGIVRYLWNDILHCVSACNEDGKYGFAQ